MHFFEEHFLLHINTHLVITHLQWQDSVFETESKGHVAASQWCGSLMCFWIVIMQYWSSVALRNTIYHGLDTHKILFS